MTNAVFVTGTDTEIGKTFAACALLHALRAKGIVAVGYKPIAAGASPINGEPVNDDALKLLAASSAGFALREINPYCLPEPIAPHLAARKAGIVIEPRTILEGYSRLQSRSDYMVVEGVGGFLVPLTNDYDTGKLAQDLALPVILVVGLRLGCISHALLTAEAIRARGLELQGWIGNTLDPTMTALAENIATLQRHLGTACLGIIPYLPTGEAREAAGHLVLPD